MVYMFRNSKDSLKDIRTAYILIAILSVSLIFLEISVCTKTRTIEEMRVSKNVEAVYECVGSLEGYALSERADERTEYAVTFKNAVMRLNISDELRSKLLDYANKIRYLSGEPNARRLADEFLVIARTDNDAERLTEFFGITEEYQNTVCDLPQRYLKQAAEYDAGVLAQGICGFPNIFIKDGHPEVKAYNLWMDFSPTDGGFTEFFCLYYEKGDNIRISEVYAKDLSEKLIGDAEILRENGLCGYDVFTAVGKNDVVKFVFGASGKLYAALKVKR